MKALTSVAIPAVSLWRSLGHISLFTLYQHRMKSCRFLVVCSVGLAVSAGTRGVAQVTSVRSGSERFDRDSARAGAPLTDPNAMATAARSAQLQFEQFRRSNLPE